MNLERLIIASFLILIGAGMNFLVLYYEGWKKLNLLTKFSVIFTTLILVFFVVFCIVLLICKIYENNWFIQ